MTEHTVRSWDEIPMDPPPSYSFLPAFEDYIEDSDADLDDVREMFQRVVPHFTELAGQTIYVGMTHEECTFHGEPYAMADPYNMMVYLNTDSLTEYQTLFHEFAHLQIYYENQNGADHPQTSEPYCSILAVSKMPPDMVYREHIAYLGEPDVPNEEYPGICQRALEYRESHRNYIQKAKEWLEI
jgi:hypothetical protein